MSLRDLDGPDDPDDPGRARLVDRGPVGSPLRAGCTRPVRLGPPGPTRQQARGPRWRRTSHGFYVPSSVSADRVGQRIVEASVVAPPGCGVSGWASLRWRGARWFDGVLPGGELRPVDLVVSTRTIRPQPGLAICEEAFDPRLLEWVDGVPVLDPRYSVSFCMRYAPTWRHAAADLSMATHDDLVSVDEVSAFLTPGQNGMTGVPQARKAVGWGVENAWSPAEVMMAILWEHDGAFPRPLLNRPVFDLAGRHVATPDLLDPVAGVAGEFDGPTHLDRARRDRDLRRDGDLRHHDLEVVYMTGPDLVDPRRFLGRLADAYRRAARRPTADRSWTVEHPAWWTPTETVEQRRALTPDQRRRFLRRRAGG